MKNIPHWLLPAFAILSFLFVLIVAYTLITLNIAENQREKALATAQKHKNEQFRALQMCLDSANSQLNADKHNIAVDYSRKKNDVVWMKRCVGTLPFPLPPLVAQNMQNSREELCIAQLDGSYAAQMRASDQRAVNTKEECYRLYD